MKPIDYIYRFDPDAPAARVVPTDAETARKVLEDGNRMFSTWMESRFTGNTGGDEGREAPSFVIRCNGLGGKGTSMPVELPKQRPFAVVVGCSDARVPTELLFGQGFNDIFVVRVAGNVLGDVCVGSIDFALGALAESVRVIVMLGHSGCGAVSGAVDAYLDPQKFWTSSLSPMLRDILQRVFVSVREAARGFDEVWGPDAREMPGYREALIEASVCMNAAFGAYSMQQDVVRSGKKGIDVLFGVHNVRNHQVCVPVNPNAPRSDDNVRLAPAPTSPAEFDELAVELATILKGVELAPDVH